MVIAVEGSLLHQQIPLLGDCSSRLRDSTDLREQRRSVSLPGLKQFKSGRTHCAINSSSRVSLRDGGTISLEELKVGFPRGIHVAAPHSVNAAIAETDGPELKWWEKGTSPNISDVHSTQEFLDALSVAGDKLVVVEFYATWCGSCRALYPKFCKLAEQYSDANFIKVNFDENKPMCKSLNIKVLPFFHIYKGAAGKLEGFSCSLSKLQKLKDAIATHYSDSVEEEPVPEGQPVDAAAAIPQEETSGTL